jgi:hypothetical protein
MAATCKKGKPATRQWPTKRAFSGWPFFATNTPRALPRPVKRSHMPSTSPMTSSFPPKEDITSRIMASWTDTEEMPKTSRQTQNLLFSIDANACLLELISKMRITGSGKEAESLKLKAERERKPPGGLSAFSF